MDVIIRQHRGLHTSLILIAHTSIPIHIIVMFLFFFVPLHYYSVTIDYVYVCNTSRHIT